MVQRGDGSVVRLQQLHVGRLSSRPRNRMNSIEATWQQAYYTWGKGSFQLLLVE